MPKFQVNHTALVITLLTSTYTIFAPLDAWIDHIFDFHRVEIEADWNGSKEAWKENDINLMKKGLFLNQK